MLLSTVFVINSFNLQQLSFGKTHDKSTSQHQYCLVVCVCVCVCVCEKSTINYHLCGIYIVNDNGDYGFDVR